MPGGASFCRGSLHTSEPAVTSLRSLPGPTATTKSGSCLSGALPATPTEANDQSAAQCGPSKTLSVSLGMPGLPLISASTWAAVGWAAVEHLGACDGVG